MSYIRRSLLVLGITSSFLGLLLIMSPTLASVIELSDTVEALPFVLIGLTALIFGARYLLRGTASSLTMEAPQRRAPDYPSPENRPQYAHPGTQFIRQLAEIAWIDRQEKEPASRLALSTELQDIAVIVLSQTENWSKDDIEARLDTGEWTENPQAAAFFADDIVPSLSIQQHLRSLQSTEPPFARRARHAIAELAGRYNGTDISPTLFESAHTGESPPIVTTRHYWSPYEPETTRVLHSQRTQWMTATALIAGGLGIITLQPSLFLLALFGITVAGYARVATPPSGAVEVTRMISNSEPDPEQLSM